MYTLGLSMTRCDHMFLLINILNTLLDVIKVSKARTSGKQILIAYKFYGKKGCTDD